MAVEDGRKAFDFDFGKRGDPIQPVVERLRQMGIIVNPNSISHFRDGSFNTLILQNRKKAAELLASESVRGKDFALRALAIEGILARGQNRTKGFRGFGFRGFEEKLAQRVNSTQLSVRKVIKATRLDLAIEGEGVKGNELDTLRDSAKRFLTDFRSRPDGRSSTVEAFITRWDGRSAATFYRLLPQQPFATMGAWGPYEMDFLRQYYGRRIALGSHPSTLDTLLLESTLGSRSDASVFEEVAKKTNIKEPADQRVLTEYRYLLLSGTIKPAPPN